MKIAIFTYSSDGKWYEEIQYLIELCNKRNFEMLTGGTHNPTEDLVRQKAQRVTNFIPWDNFNGLKGVTPHPSLIDNNDLKYGLATKLMTARLWEMAHAANAAITFPPVSIIDRYWHWITSELGLGIPIQFVKEEMRHANYR